MTYSVIVYSNGLACIITRLIKPFIIKNIISYQKNEMKQHVEGNKMNVTVRNFPQEVADIQKKWKIKDGGDTYAFFTTNLENDKIVLLCAKI